MYAGEILVFKILSFVLEDCLSIDIWNRNYDCSQTGLTAIIECYENLFNSF